MCIVREVVGIDGECASSLPPIWVPCEVAISRGTLVAGFGKGKWIRGEEAKDADTNLTFQLTSDQDEVLFNGALVSLRQLYMEQRKKDPEALPAGCLQSPHPTTLVIAPALVMCLGRVPWSSLLPSLGRRRSGITM